MEKIPSLSLSVGDLSVKVKQTLSCSFVKDHKTKIGGEFAIWHTGTKQAAIDAITGRDALITDLHKTLKLAESILSIQEKEITRLQKEAAAQSPKNSEDLLSCMKTLTQTVNEKLQQLHVLGSKAPAPDNPTPSPPAPPGPVRQLLPNPPKFDGTRSQFRSWSAAVRRKLLADSDCLPSPSGPLLYVASLLAGPIADVISNYDLTSEFINAADLLSFIAQECIGSEDFQARAARDAYRELRQGDDTPFNEFYLSFSAAARAAEVREDSGLLLGLEEKILVGLAEAVQGAGYRGGARGSYEAFVEACRECDEYCLRGRGLRERPGVATAAVDPTTTMKSKLEEGYPYYCERINAHSTGACGCNPSERERYHV